jgi:hypothetical protein
MLTALAIVAACVALALVLALIHTALDDRRRRHEREAATKRRINELLDESTDKLDAAVRRDEKTARRGGNKPGGG